ncbi:MAG: nitric oxide synthase [Ruminococcus sp.]|nr:nitric oxide synthase [Ruminococcus sp.]
MKTAVRYYSKSGNTKSIARAIAGGAGTKAVSITDEPKLKEHVDVLFLGGAPYANIMAPELRKYAEELSSDMVGRVVLFTTSNWSRRTVYALRKLLTEKGIEIEQEHFYAHMLHIKGRLDAAKEFGRRLAEKSE